MLAATSGSDTTGESAISGATGDLSPNLARRFCFIVACLLIVSGLLTIVGWHQQLHTLVQPVPEWKPLDYVTACISVISGVGFLGLAHRSRAMLLVTAVILALCAALVLIGHLASINLPIPFPFDPGSTGQPTTVSTALGFLFIAASFWLSGTRPFLLRPLVIGMLGSALIVLALITTTSHFLHAASLYGWAYYASMSLQVVIFFVLSGAATIAVAWRKAREEALSFSWPLIASAGVMTATVVLWVALMYEENAHVRRAVAVDAERAKAELLWQLDPRILALNRMAAHWARFGKQTREQWELDAHMNISHESAYRSIHWVDNAFRVQWTVPVSDREKWYRRAIVTDAGERRKLDEARARKTPLILHQPGEQEVMQAFVPVHDNAGHFLGFISGTFNARQLLDDILGRRFTDHGISVILDNRPIYRRDVDPGYEEPWGQEAVLDLYGLRLNVRLWPQHETLSALLSPIPWSVLSSGFVLAMLLFWAVYLHETLQVRARQIARVNRVLTDEVEVRREAEAQLNLSQMRYRSLFDSIRDAIVVADRNNLIVSCNPAFTQLFGYTLEEVRGFDSSMTFENPGDAIGLRQVLDESEPASSVRTVGYKRKTGEVFAGETGMFYLRDADQHVTGYIKLIRDVTERERAAGEIERKTAYEQLLHAVASAGNRAASTEELARTAIDLVCSVTGWPVGHFYEVSSEGGRLVAADGWHSQEGDRYSSLRAVLMGDRVKGGEGLIGRVLQSGQPEWSTDISTLPAAPCSAAATAAGLGSALAFPVLVRADIVGVLLFFSRDKMGPDPSQLDALEQITTHLGRTIERVRARENIERLNQDLEQRVSARTRQLAEMNAELEIEIAERERLEQQLENALAHEREARLDAEAAHHRLAFLADATVKLSASLDYRVTLDTLAKLAVPYLADWCAIDSLQPDGAYALVAASHTDPDKRQLIYDLARMARFNGENLSCHSEAIAGQKGRTEALHNEQPDGALKQLGCECCICVPLHGAERVVGVLTLVRVRPGSRFTDADRHLAEELARRAALAMDHAELYRAAQEEIAERRRAEESLAAESGRLAVTLQSIGDGVITTDTEGRVVLINTVAEKLTGWPASEAIGRRLHEVFCLEVRYRPEVDRAQHIIQRGSAFDFGGQTLLCARDGSRRMIADSGAPIRDSSGSVIGAVLVFRDITEQQRMEEDLIKAQKLESIGLLAGGIAHDFNNILTAILGNISLARVYCEAGSEAHVVLAEAEKAFWRARALTQQLLTFARGGAPMRKTATLNELLIDTVGFALRGANARCKFDIDPELRPVSYDAGQMSQVFNNLVINATQSMPNGGLITVIGRNVTLMDRQVGRLPAGDYVRITISDQGTGIAEENLLKIFDPYFTTKPRGSGLGLATAYSIIQRHDGHISVDSRPGEGAQFYVYVPASSEPVGQELLPDITGTERGQGRVLLMDDEPAVREVAARLLRTIGYDVEEAHCGETAVNLYKEALETGRRFDAVILDLTVPGGVGGRECVQRLLEVDPDVKAIVSSGYSNDPVMAEYGSHGFRAVVSKPYQLRELADSVSQVLQAAG